MVSALVCAWAATEFDICQASALPDWGLGPDGLSRQGLGTHIQQASSGAQALQLQLQTSGLSARGRTIQYTETWQSAWELGPCYSSCTLLISNKAKMHYNTTVGCHLEAPVKGGGIQNLDSTHGHCDSVMSRHQGLNLKLAKWTMVWAIWTLTGQNIPKVGETFQEVGKKYLFIRIKASVINNFFCIPQNRGGNWYAYIASSNETAMFKTKKLFIFAQSGGWLP